MLVPCATTAATMVVQMLLLFYFLSRWVRACTTTMLVLHSFDLRVVLRSRGWLFNDRARVLSICNEELVGWLVTKVLIIWATHSLETIVKLSVIKIVAILVVVLVERLVRFAWVARAWALLTATAKMRLVWHHFSVVFRLFARLLIRIVKHVLWSIHQLRCLIDIDWFCFIKACLLTCLLAAVDSDLAENDLFIII